jgi:hypothetical protein
MGDRLSMSRLLTREEAFKQFKRGKLQATVPISDMGKALRVSGPFPTEAFVNSLPPNSGEQSTFNTLAVPPLPITFEDALLVFSNSPDNRTMRLEDLAFALQGGGEPIADDHVDELLTIASSKCSHVEGGISIDSLIKAVHELYSFSL